MWSLLIFAALRAISGSSCDVVMDIGARKTQVFTMKTQSANICFSNHIPSTSYEFRLYAPGYSKYSYSPEKYRVTKEVDSVMVTRKAKTLTILAGEHDSMVITVDPLIAGAIPSALVPVIYLGALVILLCVMVTIKLQPFLRSFRQRNPEKVV